MIPYGITAYRLAEELLIPRTRIERIIREETSVTVDTALRLARYFERRIFGSGCELDMTLRHAYQRLQKDTA